MTTDRYHHGNLREALVDAAVEVAREHGPSGLAVRDLARRVGVSHNAAYRHFADREALVAEVAERGMVGLVATMQRRLEAVRSRSAPLRARRRLAELGRGYVEFALAEPGLFRVAFASYPEPQPQPLPDLQAGLEPGPAFEPGPALDPAVDPLAHLSAALDDLVAAGVLASARRPQAEVTCWGAVHGFAVLHLDGPLRGTPVAERDAALDVVLATIDRGLAATTGTAVRASDLRRR